MPDARAVERTMAGLRQALFETLEDLRAGKVKAQDATAIVGVANAVLKTVSVQLQFEKLKNEQKAPVRLAAMPLVPDQSMRAPQLRAVGSNDGDAP